MKIITSHRRADTPGWYDSAELIRRLDAIGTNGHVAVWWKWTDNTSTFGGLYLISLHTCHKLRRMRNNHIDVSSFLYGSASYVGFTPERERHGAFQDIPCGSMLFQIAEARLVVTPPGHKDND
jgi:hypothetical protein